MLYPPEYGDVPGFPQSRDFAVVDCGLRFGRGVLSHRSFRAGEQIARMAGVLVPEVTQHTLQIAPGRHFLDLHFTGYLLHACEPNVVLDMDALTMTACRDIHPGDYLTMDYAQTEDVLFRQFPCSCGAATCRGWVTGRDEPRDELAWRKHRRRAQRERRHGERTG